MGTRRVYKSALLALLLAAPLGALDVSSVQQTAAQPMRFGALAAGQPVTLIPVSRAAHEYYTVYWNT